MDKINHRLAELFDRWIREEASPAEKDELAALTREERNLAQLEESLQHLFENSRDSKQFAPDMREGMARNILLEFPAQNHRIHFLKTAWFRWAAAIIILFGIGTYIFTHTSQPDKEVATIQPSPKSNDVMPGSEKAILTLSNGSRVELSKATPEIIADGNLTIENSNGQLSYKNADVVAMNTMTTPKGGQYQLTLADGTRVWLNAASSITYPTAFTGNTREISITGEAYFEVFANSKKPFVVKTPKEDIVVLGTSFNVNAYAEEPSIKTSLLQGSVKVGKQILKPGQAHMDGKVLQTDVSQDIAWKNGVFNFNKTKLVDAMRQIARWYDVEVHYEGNLQSIQLGGKIGRQLTLEQLMRGLEGIDDVHFQLAGRKLIVKP